jgi:hypothetical protein
MSDIKHLRPVAEPKHPYSRPIPFRQFLPSPHHAVQWWISRTPTDNEEQQTKIVIVYLGTPEELIAAGCGPAKLIGPWRPGSRRLDSEGHKAHVKKLKGKRNGQIEFERYKPIESAIGLPGITRESVERYISRYRAEWREWKQWHARSTAAEPLTDRNDLTAATVLIERVIDIYNHFPPRLMGKIGIYLGRIQEQLLIESECIAERRATRSHLRLVVDNDNTVQS